MEAGLGRSKSAEKYRRESGKMKTKQPGSFSDAEPAPAVRICWGLLPVPIKMKGCLGGMRSSGRLGEAARVACI